MIIYNVTVKIDTDSNEEWLNWMKTVHIPDVMATSKFTEYRFSKILVDESDGINYSIQYLCQDMETLDLYLEHDAPALQQEHALKYKDKFVAFRTLLEVIA